MLNPCPACGFEVFDEPPGSYVIYPVCEWEDDHVQLRFPVMPGGANKKSLFEWQQHVLQRLPAHIVVHEGHCRCPDWRPLSEDDLAGSDRMPATGLEYFEAAADEAPSYYWRTTKDGS